MLFNLINFFLKKLWYFKGYYKMKDTRIYNKLDLNNTL